MSNGTYQCPACGSIGCDDGPCDCPPDPVIPDAVVIGRCGTCRHWSQHYDTGPKGIFDLIPRNEGSCNRIRTKARYDELGIEGIPARLDDAHVYPQSSTVFLLTIPTEFGCVLYEQQE